MRHGAHSDEPFPRQGGRRHAGRGREPSACRVRFLKVVKAHHVGNQGFFSLHPERDVCVYRERVEPRKRWRIVEKSRKCARIGGWRDVESGPFVQLSEISTSSCGVCGGKGIGTGRHAQSRQFTSFTVIAWVCFQPLCTGPQRPCEKVRVSVKAEKHLEGSGEPPTAAEAVCSAGQAWLSRGSRWR